VAKALAKGAGKLAEGVGIVIGVGSAIENFSEGNYLEGALDVLGLIPGPVGTAFDVIGLGYTIYKIKTASEEAPVPNQAPKPAAPTPPPKPQKVPERPPVRQQPRIPRPSPIINPGEFLCA
jgi:hypothetical protein